MPSLRFREEDGKPYVRGRNSTWYPDSYAMDKFHAMGLEDGGDFSWELFEELLGEEHLRTGLNGVPSHTTAEVEKFRNLDLEIQAYFDEIMEDSSRDFEDLGDVFQECLRQVLSVEDQQVRKSLFAAIAERIKGLINLYEDDEEMREFVLECKNRLIRRTPDQLCNGIRKFFELDELEWSRIRNAFSGEALSEEIAVGSVNESATVSGEASRSGPLDQLADLLRYAYEQELIPGNRVEFEVRVWKRNH